MSNFRYSLLSNPFNVWEQNMYILLDIVSIIARCIGPPWIFNVWNVASLLTHPRSTCPFTMESFLDSGEWLAQSHLCLRIANSWTKMLLPLLGAVFLCPSGTWAVAAGYDNCPGFRHYFNISEDYDGGVPDSLATGRPTVVSISYYINRFKFVMEAK